MIHLLPSYRLFLLLLFLLLSWVAPAAPDSARLTPEAIDRHIETRLAEMAIQPAPPCTDLEFLRRASLDVRGVIPSFEEIAEYLKVPQAERRSWAIERLLTDPRRGEAWAAYWDKILVGKLAQPEQPQAQTRIKRPWKEWMAERVNANAPFTDIVREIVTAEGPVDLAPQTMPLARWRDSRPDMAGTMTRAFLGKQIQCAQCHDHPYDETLTQRKFWETTAFFARVEFRPLLNADGQQRGGQLREESTGELEIPDSSPPVRVSPVWMDGTTAGRSGIGTHRRAEFAHILTDTEARQLARNLANRIWARTMGRGLVEPVDDFQNPGAIPSHPELLEALADELIASRFDLRAFERLLLSTQAYQRSAKATPEQRAMPDLFAAATLRPLTPEQLFNSLDQATDFGAAQARRGGRNTVERIAQTLQDRYLSQFVFLFGNDEMEMRTSFDFTIAQALFLFNDNTLDHAIRAGSGTTIDRIRSTTTDPARQIDYLFYAALGRPADIDEKSELLARLNGLKPEERPALLEDALWALLNSAEFRTNH